MSQGAWFQVIKSQIKVTEATKNVSAHVTEKSRICTSFRQSWIQGLRMAPADAFFPFSSSWFYFQGGSSLLGKMVPGAHIPSACQSQQEELLSLMVPELNLTEPYLDHVTPSLTNGWGQGMGWPDWPGLVMCSSRKGQHHLKHRCWRGKKRIVSPNKTRGPLPGGTDAELSHQKQPESPTEANWYFSGALAKSHYHWFYNWVNWDPGGEASQSYKLDLNLSLAVLLLPIPTVMYLQPCPPRAWEPCTQPVCNERPSHWIVECPLLTTRCLRAENMSIWFTASLLTPNT